jgi:1-aminocyclopropane-1-carboxylate deaminase/D-cysteine desulfhydrase-like pyridoxal-dependent ACC family enzyme
VIPVGGSNALGTWGYLQAVEELRQQAQQLGLRFDDIAMATGSGATAAGLGLGSHLSGMGAKASGTLWAGPLPLTGSCL